MAQSAEPVVRVPLERAVGLVQAIFERKGCSEAEARRIAERLAGANLRGHDSHGIIRTPRYVAWMDAGRVVAGRDLEVVSTNGVMAILDGHFGFGQSIGEQTVDVGIEMARANGVGVTALRHSGHLGRIGEWSERAAEAGCASLHMVNVRGSLLVAPFGARERRAGTSPFSAGVPVPGGEPIILDFATSLVAEGKVLVAARGGKPLPEGALIAGDGTASSAPEALYGDIVPGEVPDPSRGPGSLAMFGGHKGSGLNFFMEMFAGALTGSGTAGALGEAERRRMCNGMLSIYMNLEHFHSDDWFAREVRAYVEFWKSARPAGDGGEVLIPGEVERRTMAERLRDGLPVPESAWGDILATARAVGLNREYRTC